MTHLDLFSGIGGFSLAAERAGFSTVAFSEIATYPSKILKKHWPHVPNLGDISKIEFNDKINLITGGFPCQPFSVAGKRKGRNDARYLWGEFFRLIKSTKATWVVAENVTGIIPMELDNILADLENENYETTAFVLPACASDAPHRRDRLWIIANRDDKRCGNGEHHRKAGCFQENQEWLVAQIQQKWEEFKPKSWKANKASDWFEFNTRASRGDDGVPNRVDRIKALGNAISPQVAFPILAFIASIIKETKE